MMKKYMAPTEFFAVAVGLNLTEAAGQPVADAATHHLASTILDSGLPNPQKQID